MPEKKFSIGKFLVALAFVGGLFITLWVRRPQVEMEIIQGPTMGTVFRVVYFADENSPERSVVAEGVKAVLDQVNQEMSTYIQTSVISRINQSRDGDWFQLPEEFTKVMYVSMEVARKTNGFFDPTIGPLVNLWGFGSDGERVIPSDDKIRQKMEYVGYDQVIEFDSEQRRLRKIHPKAYLDFSATAKGHGADMVSDYLLELGLSDHLVEIGGDLRTRGNRRGDNWMVGLELPRPNGSMAVRPIPVNDMAIVTSGSYRNFFEQDGQHFSHTIDFRTGRPIDHPLISATVVDPELSLLADTWATAFMAMGLEESLRIAEELEIAAFFIAFEVDDETPQSSGLGQRNVVNTKVNKVSTTAFKKLFGF